jgi:hypothetical protein
MRRLVTAVAASCVITSAIGAQLPDSRELPREVADEVLLLFNAEATQRFSGRHEVARGQELQGDIAILHGPLVVGGRIIGRIVAVNADIDLQPGAIVDGDILVVGGSVLGRDSATVSGSIRTYSTRLAVRREGDRLSRRDPGEEEERSERWWRRRDGWRDRRWGNIRLFSARTYNRVEGLPIHVGPVFGREFEWGRLSVDALGIIRSADSFEWTPANIGHAAKVEVRLGRDGGVRLGARHFDIVDEVEPWQLSDTEVGLASFFLHRDYRDYFNRHGGSVYASVFRGSDIDVTTAYSHQRWATRDTRDPWTLFRDTQTWRVNPQMDEGKFHLVNTTLRYDTRDDDRNPWTGWYMVADYEYGTGRIERYAPASAGVRDQAPGGQTAYDRLFFDIRRYNRVGPEAQLNLRLVLGGWLSGDELPLQRRFSLGGPGSMPGFDFRRLTGNRFDPATVDYLGCGNYGVADLPLPQGVPAECERFALAQVEFRGDLDIDPFGILDQDREWRRRGWGRGTKWVVFANAGRGWLVGEPDGARTMSKGRLPDLSTFQTDIGFGLLLDDIGVYASKALSQGGSPVNFHIRLRPRF